MPGFTPEELERARQARNAAAREWRTANPERAKAIQVRYYLKKAKQEEVKNNENNTSR